MTLREDGPLNATRGLLAAAAGDQALARELAVAFLDYLPTGLADLAAAVEAEDASHAQAAAHTLKGAAGALGFVEVAERAGRIEKRALEGTLAAVTLKTDVERLIAASDEASRAARAFLGE